MLHLLHTVSAAVSRAKRGAAALLAATLMLGSMVPAYVHAESASAPLAQSDERSFSETGYSIPNDDFWNYFLRRGGLRTFGYPVSNTFTFRDCDTQFFQRLVVQQCPGQGVTTMNLLDAGAGLLPYTRFNGITIPASDPTFAAAAPAPSDPDYAQKVVDFVRSVSPETIDGQPVSFFSTFLNTVTFEEAFPTGEGNPDLLPLIALELWGFPTSPPQTDPNNHDFIYQRFQRGVMHFDKGCQCTQGLLLADNLKNIITGQNLPADLAQQAANSPLLRSAVNGLVPAGTVYAGAFDGVATSEPALLPLPTAQPTPPARPTPTVSVPAAPAPIVSVNQSIPSPDYGLSMFLWGHASTTARDLGLATSAGFRWQKTLFQWKAIEGRGKGQYDWSEADRVVKASNAAGVKVIARIDFQPDWARPDLANKPGLQNGPPANYQDFSDFISAFVNRYKTGSPNGTVAAIEVWNEVNLDKEWGFAPINQSQARDYVRLLTGAYRAAKAADPAVIVVTAGLSPTGVETSNAMDDVKYLQWLYDAGMKGGVNYDVLGAHGNTQAPCVECALNSLPTFPHPSFYFRRIEQLREVMVRNGDADRQMWLLEFGWTSDQVNPNYKWFAVSEQQKAENVVKAFQYAKQNWPWMGVMTVWTFTDPQWTEQNEQYWWAITNPDGTVRPAYNAFKTARQNGTLN